MAGLRRICKFYGGMKITKDGKTTEYVWDYIKDEPVEKSKFDAQKKDAAEKRKQERLKKKQAKKDLPTLF